MSLVGDRAGVGERFDFGAEEAKEAQAQEEARRAQEHDQGACADASREAQRAPADTSCGAQTTASCATGAAIAGRFGIGDGATAAEEAQDHEAESGTTGGPDGGPWHYLSSDADATETAAAAATAGAAGVVGACPEWERSRTGRQGSSLCV